MKDLSKSFLITKEEAHQRADLFLIQKKVVSSRSEALKIFEKQHVTLKEKILKASYRLKESDILSVQLPAPLKKESILSPYPLKLDILFEDSFLLVLNKPAGLVVHPGAGHKDKTLVNALVAQGKKLSPGSDPLRPGIVHRLDKETSGLLLIAKSSQAEKELISCFKTHEIQRDYYAIVSKAPRVLEGEIESWIRRHPVHRKKFHSSQEPIPGAKKAHTFYKTFKSHESGLTCLQCQLKTGRTHQIRVHLSSIACPVLGDKVYGRPRLSSLKDSSLKEELKKLNRIALHAFQLQFKHPISKKKMIFKSPWPQELQALLKKLGW